MQKVYVQNRNEEPLMPCKPAKARHLLDSDKAEVVNLCPFTIRLGWDCESNTQEVIAGLDTGAVNVGCSAISNNKLLYASETKLRTDISKKMQRRAKYRRNRRSRKTRYRQARFNNRKSDRQLPPSLKSKLDSTVNVVRRLAKIFPISKVMVEIAKFDTQKLQNPEISGKDYQQGQMQNYDNVKAYVLYRDNYICQICKGQFGRLRAHHIIQRKDGGSNKPDNLVTLHDDCHKKFHNGEIKHKFKKPKEYKEATQVTTLKDHIVSELRKKFDVEVTFGHITRRNRLRLNLPKSHCFDAIAICNPKKIERTESIFKRVCISRGRYQLTKGIRSEQKLPKGKLFGYKQWDKVKIGNQIGFIKGIRSSGFFDVCDIDGNSISHSIKYTHLQRLCLNNVMEVEAVPPNPLGFGIPA